MFFLVPLQIQKRHRTGWHPGTTSNDARLSTACATTGDRIDEDLRKILQRGNNFSSLAGSAAPFSTDVGPMLDYRTYLTIHTVLLPLFLAPTHDILDFSTNPTQYYFDRLPSTFSILSVSFISRGEYVITY